MDPIYYRNSTLKRSCKPMKRKKPINRISKRGRTKFSELLKSSIVVRERSGGQCEFYFNAEYAQQWRCNNRGDHMHHIKPQSQGADHSPSNLMHLCFECHRWIHDNPKRAREIGVLK